LTAIARQAGAARDRGRLHAKLAKLFQDGVNTLVATIEAKASYTHGHSERVTEVAVKIAQEMAMDAAYTEKIRLSALLHDIGKIGVSEKILRKPARLTDEEFAQIKKHPVIGADIVENIESLQEEALGVRYHHEKWNGTGYPEGLKGEEIPLIARIICVSDSFDAMTSNRPYRKNFDIEEVIREFERCAQVQFDARVVDAFIRLVKRGDVKPVFLLQAENAPEPERKKSSGVYQAPGPV
ncbi:MAG: HD-GYP domain-containing protein, partial [Planctomycetes bacterium]|nr:HD-GYP domain-containing protein [Planctomycetota bacterium]